MLHSQNRTAVTLVGFILMVGVHFAIPLRADSILISGKVVDKETGDPLAYATIAIDNYKIGTITNLAGEFEIHIPESLQDDILIVSMLGYVDYKVMVSEIPQVYLNIELLPSKVLLDEVMISELLPAGDLLKVALARITLNYPMSAVGMDGFYRETKMVNGEYVDLLEAALKIYDKNYEKPRDRSRLRERVALVEVRRSLEYNYELQKYFSQYNVLEDLLLENNIKYRSFSDEPEFYDQLKREKVPGYNNQPINRVTLKLPAYYLELYIDDNFAIRKLYLKWGDGTAPIYSFRRSRKLENNVMMLEKQIEFQEIDGKLYLKYIATNYKSNWLNLKTGEQELSTDRSQALLISKINTENPKWVKNSEKMKRYGLQFQHEAYNREFWSNYTMIKKMPLSERAIFDLEKMYSLEEQFESYR